MTESRKNLLRRHCRCFFTNIKNDKEGRNNVFRDFFVVLMLIFYRCDF